MKPKILVIDDYTEHAENLKSLLDKCDYQCETTYSAEDGLQKTAAKRYDLILLDNKLPGMDGLQFVRTLREQENDTPVIMYSAFGDSHQGSESAKLGVYDFLTKAEENIQQLYESIEATIQSHQILTRQKFDSQYFSQKYNFVGVSPAIQKIFSTIESVADSQARILLIGENGVGKNVLAEAIHKISNRAQFPFVEVSIQNYPETLIESELFGHEKGAFTGAAYRRCGKIALAHHGTLFLDQIDDASVTVQAKLLRFIESGKFEALGSNTTQSIDVRIICAAQSNLSENMKQRRFREDLYYRIAQVEITIPPLRERKEDVVYLAKHYVRKYCLQYNKPMMEIAPNALDVLLEYAWPGNVRELQFLIERTVLFKKQGPILANDIKILGNNHHTIFLDEALSFKEARQKFERLYIIRTLLANDWNVQRAAEKLNVDRTNLYKKIQHYNIHAEKKNE